MRRLAVIFLTATVLTNLQTSHAQGVGPIHDPDEHIATDPEIPQAACTSYWGLPTPIFDVDWREFPPPGLLEERPERFDLGFRRWEVGVGDFDSVIGPRYFTYDESGRLATWTVTWGTFQDPSKDHFRTSYDYDASGNLIRVETMLGDSTSLTSDERILYEYDAEDRISGLETHEWHEVGGWYMLNRVRCVYDEAGRLEWRIGELCKLTPVATPSCQDSDSTGYTYDESRIVAEYRRSRVTDESWGQVFPSQHQYDQEGRLIETIDSRIRTRFKWSYDDFGRVAESEVSSFTVRKRQRYDYQYAGLVTRVANDDWIATLKAWAEEGELRYEYGQRLNLLAEYKFVGPPFEWTRRRYEYDSRDKLVREIFDDSNGSDWRESVVHEYAYHDAGFLEEFLLKQYVYGSGAPLELQDRVVYGYAVGTGISGGEEIPADRVQLGASYPNPSSLETTISYTLATPSRVDLYVFDLMGRRVGTVDSGYRSAGQHESRFRTADLPSGVYFYRIEAGGSVSTRQIVVTK